jgi:predicted MPP superfamily phosphohydrolase
LGSRLARWVGRTWAHVTYGRKVEPLWFEINQLEVPILDLPEEFDGFRIAQLTDIHFGHHLPRVYLQKVIEKTLAEQPDLIVLTGDFVHKGYRHVREVTETLREFQSPHGVFAVLGNHDFSVRNALGFRRHRGLHRAIQDGLEANNIRVLRNEAFTMNRELAHLHLAGLDDLWSRECDPEKALGRLDPREPRIVLAHNPQSIHIMKELRCDLMLSGHTHGGQIDLPVLGRIFLGKKARRLAAGMYTLGNHRVYVNKGIGFGFRFRYGVRPEIAILTLRRSVSDAAQAVT